jgi:Tfp pilus assembly protein PilX
MKSRRQQSGATLVVSMIMLMVLTVLVVYSIRSGNTNLRIAGNMQRQTEAQAATQQAIEKVIEQIKASDNITLVGAQSMAVTSAGANYTVTTNSLGAAGACIMQVPVSAADLNPANPDDVPCFQSQDVDKAITASGTVTSVPSACNQQNWEIRASVNDASSGTQMTQVQGLTIRMPSTVACP